MIYGLRQWKKEWLLLAISNGIRSSSCLLVASRAYFATNGEKKNYIAFAESDINVSSVVALIEDKYYIFHP